MKNRVWMLAALAAVPALLFVMAGAPAESRGSRAEKALRSMPKMHRVVFEVNVEGVETWQSILTNVENLQKALGKQSTSIEVVSHGKGLGLLLTPDAELKARMARLASDGVVFAACENTMRRKNIRKEDLPDFATTVPSGVAEVVLKQEAGWSYIKAGS